MTKKILIYLTLTSLISVPCISSAYQPAILSEANIKIIDSLQSNQKAVDVAASTDCSNPDNEGSLAKKQAEVIEQKKALAYSTSDLDKYFKIGSEKGCFTSLNNFPDLSISIPSFGSIISALQKTLQSYATRKVCNVVNNALEKSIGPIADKLEEVSASGQLDLSGQVNKALTKKYYEIDPELGRVSTQASTSTTFKW